MFLYYNHFHWLEKCICTPEQEDGCGKQRKVPNCFYATSESLASLDHRRLLLTPKSGGQSRVNCVGEDEGAEEYAFTVGLTKLCEENG